MYRHCLFLVHVPCVVACEVAGGRAATFLCWESGYGASLCTCCRLIARGLTSRPVRMSLFIVMVINWNLIFLSPLLSSPFFVLPNICVYTHLSLSLYIYIYIYIYVGWSLTRSIIIIHDTIRFICMYVYVCTYIYIYRERERWWSNYYFRYHYYELLLSLWFICLKRNTCYRSLMRPVDYHHYICDQIF